MNQSRSEMPSDRIAAQIWDEQADVNATRGAAIRRGVQRAAGAMSDRMQTLVIRGEITLDSGKRGNRTWARFVQDELGYTGLVVESAEPVAPHTGVSVLMDETDSDEPVAP